MTLHKRVLSHLIDRVCSRRKPDVVIGGADNPYMLRWWIFPRNRFFNVYLHRFLRSDDDRALHDHPWGNMSWILEGKYLEIVPVNPAEPSGPTRAVVRMAGDFAIRKSRFAHRIELLLDTSFPGVKVERPVWSLFFTGPRVRDWGFWCPAGWRHWKDFTGFRKTGNGHEVGPGCGDA
jgi:hypothetical protein